MGGVFNEVDHAPCPLRADMMVKVIVLIFKAAIGHQTLYMYERVLFYQNVS